MGWQTLYEKKAPHHSTELWVDFKLIVTDLTLPISTAFDQAAQWPRWQDPTCRENLPPRLRAADVPFGTQTNKKKKKSVSTCTGGPTYSAPPIQALWLFLFTAPVTLSEMNWKITNQRPGYDTDMHPPTPIKTPSLVGSPWWECSLFEELTL